MAKDTDKGSKPMPERWHTIIAGMVLEWLPFEVAGTKPNEITGKPLYSPKYIKTNGHQIKKDARFCKALAQKRAENERKTEDRREEALRKLDAIIEDEHAATRDVIRAIEVQAKMCGWMSERIVHETPERQRVLDESERREAARLTSILLDTTRPKAKQIESKVVED